MYSYVLTNYSWLVIVTCQWSLVTPAVQVPERLFWFCGDKFAFFPTYHQTKTTTTKTVNKKSCNKVKVSKLGEYPSFPRNFREIMKQLWALSVNVGERMSKGTGNICAAISVYIAQMIMSYHLMYHYLDFGISWLIWSSSQWFFCFM